MRASPRAVAFPMPRLAPVIRQTFPFMAVYMATLIPNGVVGNVQLRKEAVDDGPQDQFIGRPRNGNGQGGAAGDAWLGHLPPDAVLLSHLMRMALCFFAWRGGLGFIPSEAATTGELWMHTCLGARLNTCGHT